MHLHELGWTQSNQTDFHSLGDSSLEPARINEESRDHYRVWHASGEALATVCGRLRHRAGRREDLPVIGDWVAIDRLVATEQAMIRAMLPRRSLLVRRAAGSPTTAQPLAANLDLVFVMTSVGRNFNPRRIERMLALVWESGAEPVVVLSKVDLCDDPGPFIEQATEVAVAVPIVAVSAITGDGMDAIRERLAPGRTVAVIGSSGVGKSTLANALLGAEVLQVRAIRDQDGRGRHTTTHREMVRLPAGAILIDTPGLREVGLWDTGVGVETAFADVHALACRCRFRDCTHVHEPGCAVRAAVADGSLDEGRLASYHKLRRELAFVERRRDRQARLEETRRWKMITKEHRRRTRSERQSGG